ncbi:MAG: hypothetical protein FJ170_05565 [Gammaproteobacteria bacterium]|nr:hypothetical protein [Gammaproteobacteria bacterium]
MHRILLFMLVTVLAGCGAKPPATDLLIPVNVRCSTCTDYIRCEAAAGNPAVGGQAFSLYALEARGPGNEITSITEYFLQFAEPKTRFGRPLSVHVQTTGATGQPERRSSMGLTVTIDQATHRLELPDAWIDQRTGEWHGRDDSLRGTCRILGREQGRQAAGLFVEMEQ